MERKKSNRQTKRINCIIKLLQRCCFISYGQTLLPNLSHFLMCCFHQKNGVHAIRLNGTKVQSHQMPQILHQLGAAIAQWICRRLPSCHPGFESPRKPSMLLLISIIIVSFGKDENKQKEAGIDPFFKKILHQTFSFLARRQWHKQILKYSNYSTLKQSNLIGSCKSSD